jgi:hypothetical protein
LFGVDPPGHRLCARKAPIAPLLNVRFGATKKTEFNDPDWTVGELIYDLPHEDASSGDAR